MSYPPRILGTRERAGSADGLRRGPVSAPQDRPRCGCCLKPVEIIRRAGEAFFPRFTCRCQDAKRCGRCERCLNCCAAGGACARKNVPVPRPGVVGYF